MYSEEEVAGAVAAGVMSEDTAKAFRSYVARARGAPSVDEEYVRLVTGFNDVFVVIACSLLLGAVYWIGRAFAPWLGAVTLSAIAWALAEFFTLKRHMALPSIILMMAFAAGMFASANALLDSVAAASGLAAVAAWAHWLRFKVPITVAVGAGAVVGLLVAVLLRLEVSAEWINVLVALSGVSVFLLAMRWDRSDIGRKTRRADIAFWLHLLAAPLVVHPIFSVLGLFDGRISFWQTLGVVFLYGLISLASLATDRRALMVSALAYVLYSFSALLREYGLVSMAFSMTALVLGTALLLLSAFWHSCRDFAFRLFPATLRSQLPPLQ